MKTIKILTLLFVTASITFGCSDNDDKKYTVEDPLEQLYINTGFSKITNTIDYSNYEYGLVFSPKYNGTLNAINVKLPATNNMLRVTIWDYETQQPIRTEIVNVNSAGVLIKKEILPLEVKKDVKYLITKNSNDWYERKKPDGTNTAYPIEAGSIVFHQYRWTGGSSQTFPTQSSLYYIAGDLSFDYQRK
jgi:hypothetical protein